MSFNDLSKKSAEPHVDTSAQAEARAQAAADVKAKADAKTARAAVHRESKKAPHGATTTPDAAKEKTGAPHT